MLKKIKFIHAQKWQNIYSSYASLHVFVDLLQGPGSKAHVLQNLCVGVWVLQSLSLKLYGGQCAIDLDKLLLQALLFLQGPQGSWYRKIRNGYISPSIAIWWPTSRVGHSQRTNTDFFPNVYF